MNLAIVECRSCGSAYWVDAELASGAIAGGPCCFGHPVLDIETYPTEKAAKKAREKSKAFTAEYAESRRVKPES